LDQAGEAGYRAPRSARARAQHVTNHGRRNHGPISHSNLHGVDMVSSESEDSWQHTRIVLKPHNPMFHAMAFDGTEEGKLRVVAEFLEVLSGPPNE
jgi:hypothetical protein